MGRTPHARRVCAAKGVAKGVATTPTHPSLFPCQPRGASRHLPVCVCMCVCRVANVEWGKGSGGQRAQTAPRTPPSRLLFLPPVRSCSSFPTFPWFERTHLAAGSAPAPRLGTARAVALVPFQGNAVRRSRVITPPYSGRVMPSCNAVICAMVPPLAARSTNYVHALHRRDMEPTWHRNGVRRQDSAGTVWPRGAPKYAN